MLNCNIWVDWFEMVWLLVLHNNPTENSNNVICFKPIRAERGRPRMPTTLVPLIHDPHISSSFEKTEYAIKLLSSFMTIRQLFSFYTGSCCSSTRIFFYSQVSGWIGLNLVIFQMRILPTCGMVAETQIPVCKCMQEFFFKCFYVFFYVIGYH